MHIGYLQTVVTEAETEAEISTVNTATGVFAPYRGVRELSIGSKGPTCKITHAVVAFVSFPSNCESDLQMWCILYIHKNSMFSLLITS